jgi:hypothetical protein
MNVQQCNPQYSAINNSCRHHRRNIISRLNTESLYIIFFHILWLIFIGEHFYSLLFFWFIINIIIFLCCIEAFVLFTLDVLFTASASANVYLFTYFVIFEGFFTQQTAVESAFGLSVYFVEYNIQHIPSHILHEKAHFSLV